MRKWKYKLDISDIWEQVDNDKITVEEYIKKLIPRLKTLPQYKEEPNDGISMALSESIHELEVMLTDDPNDADRFDEIINGFYDWADFHGVWVNLHGNC